MSSPYGQPPYDPHRNPPVSGPPPGWGPHVNPYAVQPPGGYYPPPPGYPPHVVSQVFVGGPRPVPVNHGLHALATLVTCGLWLPVWIVMAATHSRRNRW